MGARANNWNSRPGARSVRRNARVRPGTHLRPDLTRSPCIRFTSLPCSSLDRAMYSTWSIIPSTQLVASPLDSDTCNDRKFRWWMIRYASEQHLRSTTHFASSSQRRSSTRSALQDGAALDLARLGMPSLPLLLTQVVFLCVA
jgi:hypothetical protein